LLKIGCALILIAGVGLVGFVGYYVVSSLIFAPGINPFFKALILCAGVGVILTLIGLVIEKRKEDKHVPSDDK
jgi:lipopolysaccharide export LptBFGC system permease protein LptF